MTDYGFRSYNSELLHYYNITFRGMGRESPSLVSFRVKFRHRGRYKRKTTNPSTLTYNPLKWLENGSESSPPLLF